MKKILVSIIVLGMALLVLKGQSAVLNGEADFRKFSFRTDCEAIGADRYFIIPDLRLELRWVENEQTLYVFRTSYRQVTEIYLDGTSHQKTVMQTDFDEAYQLIDGVLLTRIYHSEQKRCYRIYVDDDVQQWRLRIIEEAARHKVVFKIDWAKTSLNL